MSVLQSVLSNTYVPKSPAGESVLKRIKTLEAEDVELEKRMQADGIRRLQVELLAKELAALLEDLDRTVDPDPEVLPPE